MSEEQPIEKPTPSDRALPHATEKKSLQQIGSIRGAAASRFPGPDQVILIKGRRGWANASGFRLEHNLSWGVGLLELANAGDFAANVWNDVPVPLFAAILMAFGGTLAGMICIFAFADAVKAWHNVCFLRFQHKGIKAEKIRCFAVGQPSGQLAITETITWRELRMETINRWAMDILMGVGAVLISIGTFMAIGGANPEVWLASNILSGYLGNAPIALFGLINAVWQVEVWRVNQAHRTAANKELQGSPCLQMIRRRCFDVQLYSIVNGSAAILGGVGSMLTPTFWWGYVILIPVIIFSFLSNIWYRKRVGYDRPHIDMKLKITTSELVDEFNRATGIRRTLNESPTAVLPLLVPQPQKLNDILDFLVDHGLFEAFCVNLVNEPSLAKSLVPATGDIRSRLQRDQLLELTVSQQSAAIQAASDFLSKEGLERFKHRERFLADYLGDHLSAICRAKKQRKRVMKSDNST
ncbi:hypothetical protein JX265_008331 [Neoarthrinium moseri]|uniref:Uncharacterized protein n=1 Tax=Neoarthrinium moseri TaxID=1658444 RepID=A0A9P9WI54_9PEZI|nr:hypothetical protein JX265_008331 [Neoarthrinium moseri]